MATTAASGPRMTIGGVLARSFAAIGAAPVVFLGTSFVLTALPSLAGRYLMPSIGPRFGPGPAPGSNPLAGAWPALVGFGVVWLVLYLTAKMVLIRAAVAQGEGRPQSFNTYLAAVPGLLLPLLGLTILWSLTVWLGCLLLLVPGIMLATMWSVAIPALVAERVGLLAAFGRSRRLTKGARWQILGLFLLVFVTYFLIAMVLGIGTVALRNGQFVPPTTSPPLVSTLLSLAMQTIVVAVLNAIEGTLLVELRNWKDGFDVAELTEIFS